MAKFDGKDPTTWILQMEQFFDLNNVQNTQKVSIATLYLEPNQFVWYQWLCSHKQIITWAIFTEELTAHYEDTKSNTFFSQLISLKQKGSIIEHIEELQKLNIGVKNIPEGHRIDVFIGTLKDNIQHDVHLWEPDLLEKAFRLARKMERKIMATRKHANHNYKDGSVVTHNIPQPIRLTPQQLEEKREKRFCYSCDNKYTKGHKCAENKLFYIDCEEEEEKEKESSKEEDILLEQSLDKEEMNSTISCNALARFTTPQTIKIEGQIKKKKVIVLIDSGSTHNFIHYFNSQELFMKFSTEGKEVELRGIARKPGKIISSNDLQKVLDNHSKVFETPKVLPPIRDHDHAINLIPGSVPQNIRPYIYPYAKNSEIEPMVAKMLEAGIIQPSQSSLSTLVVLVHKKDGSWCMCPDYRELNKLTIKENFPIPIIDELMDQLRGSIYFTKLDLRSGYHQIKMKTKDIPKTTFITFRTHEGHYEFLVMPFGLTNAPSTFQGLMNSIFKPFLRKFVLVFFDDILIYKSWKDHVEHVDRVLQLLDEKQLYAKRSKCLFGVQEVEYLGHIVSHEGVNANPRKTKAIKEWKIPTSIKHLRGFLI
eukprot:PITA_23196